MAQIKLVRRERTAPEFLGDAEQDLIINSQGAELVVLGAPGSGKSATLIRKVVALIKSGVDANSILVITYGRERAADIRDEIVLQTGATAFEPLVRTFHSLAFSIINYQLTPNDPTYVLISGAEQDSFIKDLLETQISQNLWPENLKEALKTRGFAREIRDLILRAQERRLTPEILENKSDELKESLWGSAAKFWRSYSRSLVIAGHNVIDAKRRVDSSQIITEAITRLEKSPELVGKLREQFKYILIDEFQESDKAQRDLLDLIRGRELTLFLDSDSAIGVFRGADPEGALQYVSDKKFKSVMLKNNYRSAKEINELAADIASRFKGAQRKRGIEDLVSSKGITVEKLASAGECATYIASAFKSAHLKAGVPWSEMAVLLRSPGPSVTALARAFALQNIPVEVDTSALALGENPAIRPLILITQIVLGQVNLELKNWNLISDLLLSAYGGADALSMRNMKLLLADTRADGEVKSTSEIVLDILDGEVAPVELEQLRPIERIANLIKVGRKAHRSGGNISDILFAIWSNARDYDGKFLQDVWRDAAINGGTRGAAADRDLDAVIQLFSEARRFNERLPDAKPRAFIEQILGESILSDAITPKGVRSDVVSIMTVHSAKGLEWKVVALMGLQEGVWPNYKQRGTLLGSERLVEHMRTGLTMRDQIEVSAKSALIEDERRLLHVAITRAKEELIALAYSEEESEPSSYFDEIYEFVKGESSYDAVKIDLPSTLTPQSVIAKLRSAVEAGDKESAAVLQLMAKSGIASANPENWLGAKEISSLDPAIPDGEKVSVSPSNLKSFAECGLKWFIERNGGQDGDSTAQLLGSAVHGIAEMLLANPKMEVAEMEEILEQNWQLIDHNKGWVKEFRLRDAFEKVGKLHTWHNKAISKRELISVEAEFETFLGRAIFNGSVDRVERDKDGKIFIVDIKTGKNETSAAKAKENKQLAGYQLAVLEGAFKDQKISGEVLGSALVFLGTDAAGGTEQSQPPIDREIVKKEVIETAEAMAATEFIAKVNDKCRNCGVKNICPVQPHGRSLLDER